MEIKKDEDLIKFLYHGEMKGFMKHIVNYNLTNLKLGDKDKFA